MNAITLRHIPGHGAHDHLADEVILRVEMDMQLNNPIRLPASQRRKLEGAVRLARRKVLTSRPGGADVRIDVVTVETP